MGLTYSLGVLARVAVLVFIGLLLFAIAWVILDDPIGEVFSDIGSAIDNAFDDNDDNDSDTANGNQQQPSGNQTPSGSGNQQPSGQTPSGSGNDQGSSGFAGNPFTSAGNGTGFGFIVGSNFVEMGTCSIPEAESVVVDTNNYDECNAAVYQTGKLGQSVVDVIVHDGEAAVVDAYDIVVLDDNNEPVGNYSGVLKGLEPGNYRLIISDGQAWVGPDHMGAGRYCTIKAKILANGEQLTTDEPLSGWENCGF